MGTGFSAAERYLYGISALVIAAVSGVGFYLIGNKPKIQSLVVSGHSHALLFAYGAILFGLLMRQAGVSNRTMRWLALWMTLSFLGPISLIYAGVTGHTAMLTWTSPLFEGSFVAIWVVAASRVSSAGTSKPR